MSDEGLVGEHRDRRLTPGVGVLVAGGVAGALDITCAMLEAVLRGRAPVRVAQAVASGVMGRAAFDGGSRTMVLGLVLHFLIATNAALVYYLIGCRFALLRERVVLPAIALGVAVYGVMHFVVVPLSAAPFRLSHSPSALMTGLAVHVVAVGLPIVLVLRLVWRRSDRARQEESE